MEKETTSRVKWIVSLPAHQALIAVLLFAVIWLAGKNEYDDWRHRQERIQWETQTNNERKACEADKNKMAQETKNIIFEYLVDGKKVREQIQSTTDSIASDAKEIRRITKKHFLKMQKLQQ